MSARKIKRLHTKWRRLRWQVSWARAYRRIEDKAVADICAAEDALWLAAVKEELGI